VWRGIKNQHPQLGVRQIKQKEVSLLIKKARHVNENEKVDFFGREK
jgi:hypothetical protein